MQLKLQPCAYCGTKLVGRTKGHVFPQSMYPDSMPNVNRITVPECYSCKAIWEDAEPYLIRCQVDFAVLDEKQHRKLFVGMTRAQLHLKLVIFRTA